MMYILMIKSRIVSNLSKNGISTLPFQRFIIANIFLIDKNTDVVFSTEFAIFMGRGGGKTV